MFSFSIVIVPLIIGYLLDLIFVFPFVEMSFTPSDNISEGYDRMR